MLIISSRENFVDADHLARRNEVREIDLPSYRAINYDLDLPKILSGKKVLILVHGYNNDQIEIYDAYNSIEQTISTLLPGKYDYIIGYAWPGGDSGKSWWYAKKKAEGAAQLFGELLNSLSCSAIDVMSHSLGAAVTLGALLQGQSKKLIRNYFCTAPAVDNESLEPGRKYHNSLSVLDKIFIFHSVEDDVLRKLYTAAEWDHALGLRGPEHRNFVLTRDGDGVFVANCKRVVKHHSDYKKCLPLYQYMQSSMSGLPAKFVTLY